MSALTENWYLPYPTPDDPPTGAEQIQALAEATDEALTDVHAQNNLPWVTCSTLGLTLADAGNSLIGFSIAAQHDSHLFSMVGNSSLVTSRAGVYIVMYQVRSTITSGSPVPGGYIEGVVEQPNGTVKLSSSITDYGATNFIDLLGSGLATLTANTGMVLRIRNSTGAGRNMNSGGRLHLLYAGPGS